jgi:hypothetical protein
MPEDNVIYGQVCYECGIKKDIGEFPYLAANKRKKIGDICKQCLNKKQNEYKKLYKLRDNHRQYTKLNNKSKFNHYHTYFGGYQKVYKEGKQENDYD